MGAECSRHCLSGNRRSITHESLFMLISRRRFVQASAGLALASPLLMRSADAQEAPSLHFLAIGDWGKPSLTADASRVAAQMARDAEANKAAFVISTGDNFYEQGVSSVTDPLWQSAFEDVYSAQSLQCPWYVVLGNHDLRSSADAELAYALRSDRWRMPAHYYAVQNQLSDGTTVDLFFLDTNMFVDVNFGNQWFDAGADAQEQLEWLKTMLSASHADWKIVVGHHPVYSGGLHGSTSQLIAGVKPLLHEYGVQAYINGHDHDLQHIEVAGIHYLTSGGGAEARPTNAIDGTVFAASSRGFLTADISAAQLRFAFIDDNGATLHQGTIAV